MIPLVPGIIAAAGGAGGGVTDTTPDPFSFTDVADATVSTVYTSNAITVAGINAAAPITVSGGEYRIEGGAWTSSPGTINNGQQVEVRHTSSASSATATDTTLDIGGVTDTFTTTTAGGIVPTDYADLNSWYDSSDAATVLLSGSDVTRLGDKSGNLNHLFADVGFRPTRTVQINGRDAILFNDASTQWMYRNTGVFFGGDDQPYTLSMVWELDDVAVGQHLFGISNYSSGQPYASVYMNNTGPVWQMNRRGGSGSTLTTSGGTPTTGVFLITAIQHGTTASLRINGVPVVNDAALNVNSMVVNQITLGCLRLATTRFGHASGKFGEGALYRRDLSLTAGQVDGIESYLAGRWGVTL